MHIRRILLATLASAPLMAVTGCCTSSVCGCDPDSEQFDLDEPFTQAHVDHIVENWGLESADDIDCDTACNVVYKEVRGWETWGADSCTLTLPEAGSGGDTADTSDTGDGTPGSIQCSGTGYEYYCEGRRPLGHVEASGACDDALGRACASMAHLEAAAVDAFVELARQLQALDAPHDLVQRCLDAAQDERVHTRWMTALARRRGAQVPPPVAEVVPETLFDIALHNAVEGCVHETWAALAAHHRAEHAADPALRAVFGRIARDETRHGQLAWDLHAYLMTRLSAHERDQVLAAQRDALAALPELARRLGEGPRALGMPSGDHAHALATGLAQRLAA